MSEFVDIYPTLCSMLGLERPAHIDGVDLTGMMKRPAVPAKEYAVTQQDRPGGIMGYSVRSDRYRYTAWFGKGWRSWKPYDASMVQARELYDYTADPLEKANLVDRAEYKAVQKQMQAMLEHYIARQNEVSQYHDTTRKPVRK